MERKFKITVEGREYNVSVEELTDSIPYSEPPVFLPPSAHLAPTIAPARSMNNHGPATSQLNHAAAEAGDVVSTLSGVVEFVLVTVGQQVAAGERVLVVEAMKMKTPITARQDGTVSAILIKVGDGVVPGQPLVKLG